MNVRSVLRPTSPPNASISLIKCPFAGPPIEGLQGMSATLSRFIVNKSVLRPIRAQAKAASHPAWPAPTTITSYFPRTICSGGSALRSVSLLMYTDLFDVLFQVNNYFHIYDSYYGAQEVRRQ